jgi:guanylate kinase
MKKEQSLGRIAVICAPSGTGKSTLIAKLREDFKEIKWSVSYTTRAIRVGETHGKDYFFISQDDFIRRINTQNFIEWAKVHSNYYGTSRDFVDEGLKIGDKMLFDLDVQGADAMKKIYGKDAKIIFIEPPSIEVLEARLRSRGTDSEDVIRERVANARKELLRKKDYDYLLMNDDKEKAYKQLSETMKKIME